MHGADRPEIPEPLAADPALVSQREAAGIADCPATPLEAEPLPGGLPDLVLTCLGSGRQTNLAALRGTPMVINVWAQWCGPCRQEAPHLAGFAAAVGPDVLVLGIDYDDPEPALALEFAGQAGWTYAHLTDPTKQTQSPAHRGHPDDAVRDPRRRDRAAHRGPGGLDPAAHRVHPAVPGVAA